MNPRSLILAALLLSSSGPASAQSFTPAPYVVLTLGSSVDLATTLEAIHSGRGQEANPFLSHGGDVGLIAGKVAATAGLAFAMQRLGLAGHPKVAATIGYVAGIALAGLGARNARVGR